LNSLKLSEPYEGCYFSHVLENETEDLEGGRNWFQNQRAKIFFLQKRERFIESEINT
jgi:predicted cupin superfamily sugar epimerase